MARREVLLKTYSPEEIIRTKGACCWDLHTYLRVVEVPDEQPRPPRHLGRLAAAFSAVVSGAAFVGYMVAAAGLAG